ncbi:glutamine ABC transporter permease protein [Weissella oryzae SG25]|uniref:Glutamine ABC transporter permease protein n=1 Tax=Weissella oryzae (strain DSM 25784 / JCM 18191 / LMG 30913 / SG25) TaxID=1329250 RepID=A0A069D237_WEIOS|nr:ABC transporter substrate-binding protein/permease [Weissella oryzae]GAK31451.1 glutamine ABC transporter permease protein [Weissella oryzae SG25]
MRKWLLGLIIAAAAIVTGFGGFNSVQAASKPHYTITTDTTYPPFEFQTANGQFKGIDMDLLKAIAKREGFTYTLKPMSFNSGVQSVQAGQADAIIAGMTITDERRQTFDFSDPYYKSGIVIAANEKNKKVNSLADLKGQKVAVKTGTAGAEYAMSLAKKYDLKIVSFNDSNTMYADVMVGNEAAAFEDQPVMAYAIAQGTKMKIISKPAQAGDYGFAVKKGANAALLDKFNQGYASLVADGTYDKIVQSYLGKHGYNYQKNAAASADNNSYLGILKQNKDAILTGLWMTIKLTVVGIVLASIYGLILAILGVSPYAWVRAISTFFIYVFRGMPMLVLAFFIYIGLPNLTGVKIPAFTAGVITLILNEGAYIGSFVKGGFLSVDGGQMEAARSLGLPYGKAMRRIIMPQGIRLTVPSFINQFIITLKDTSILSVIGLVELTQTGTLIIARNLQGFKVWLMIAGMYLIVITLLTWVSNIVEKRIK